MTLFRPTCWRWVFSYAWIWASGSSPEARPATGCTGGRAEALCGRAACGSWAPAPVVASKPWKPSNPVVPMLASNPWKPPPWVCAWAGAAAADSPKLRKLSWSPRYAGSGLSTGKPLDWEDRAPPRGAAAAGAGVAAGASTLAVEVAREASAVEAGAAGRALSEGLVWRGGAASVAAAFAWGAAGTG